uniref:CCHC-type domain-containing protein n=1 Tax=Tanacetum cinerariifolium TaxID=118510 RepID=A0A699HVC3_TANCI|nr:hypothetical protein [Tanacetum cinerariifolium]
MYVTEQPIPPALTVDSAANVLAEWNAVYDAYNEVSYLMLGKEGKLVSQYVLKMEGYVEQLEHLGYVLPQDLSVGLILNGLTSDFAGFVRNYNMHNMGKTIGELHAMLIKYEKGKGKGKGKGKDKSYVPKPKNPKPNAKEHLEKNDACHHYKEVGHWKRNCLVYLDVLTKNKKQVGSARARKLKQGDFYLYVGNRVCTQVEAIGSYDLVLPNGLVICLDSCHYAPSITRSVVSVSRFVENRFVQCFMDYGILVSRNDVLYFNAIPSNGIYEIDMSNYVPNVNSIYNVSNKRGKHNLDSTYLWHCRLAHISKKHIGKKQHDGLLKSIDDESFDQCVSCLSGKMTRKSFPHRPERVTDLLGLIHTDVCGPLRHVSRQGASYFMTFTDDYSRYGYIYLLKHKHEFFETFKDYAIEVVARILNMVPTKKVDKIPYELWFGKVPNLSYLKVWGCEALVKRDTPDKLQQRFVKCIFIGYEKEMMGVSGRAGDLKEIQEEDTSPSEITRKVPIEVEGFEPPHEEEAPVRRSKTYKWLDAMNAEMQSMKDNQVWFLVDLPPNAKGFTQTYEVDYEENFSLVADTRAIRILIAIITFYDYEIWKMDVKTAFLNGYLDEDIYMVQPKGFIDPKHPRKVCKLQRSIYGLKQASRSWNKRFDVEIKKFIFTQNLDEPCVYQKASESNVTFLILYVDDIILMGNHIPSLQSVKEYLGKCFAMKDLGEAAFILRIRIYRDRLRRLIGLSQSAYMDKILKRYRMDNSKRGYIPIRFHYTDVKTILKYLRNTKDMFLVYGGNPKAELRVDCYCDVGLETDRDDIKSQTGYIFILNGGTVDWKSSKQSTTTMSAIEAEYITASKAGMEVVWIRKFILGLEDDENATNPPQVPPTPQAPHTLSTIKLPILKKGSSSYNDDLMYSFFANQSSGLQLDHEDLEQVDEFDLEEIDLKWQVAIISTRLKKFYKKIWRKLHFDAKEPVGFDKTKVECFNCHNTGHFTKECKSKGNQESRRRDAGNIGYKPRDNRRRPAKQDEHKAMVTIDEEGVDWTGPAEDDTKDYALMAFNSSNSGSDIEVTSCLKVCEESYAKLKKLYDEQMEQIGVASIEIQAYTLALKKVEAQLVRHKKNQLAYAEKISESDAKNSDIASCESNTSVETLESMPTPVESKPKVVSKPKVWQTVKDQDTCSQNPKVPKRDWTDLKSTSLGLGYGYTRKACFVCGSFSHLIRDCDFHKKRMAKQVELNKSKNKINCQRNDRPVWNNVQRLNHQNKYVPMAIQTKTGKFPVNVARQKFSSQATSTSIVRKVNTARPIVNEIKKRHNVYKSHSPIKRPFTKTTTPKENFAKLKVNTVGDKTVCAIRGNRETVVKTSAGCNWRSKRQY